MVELVKRSEAADIVLKESGSFLKCVEIAGRGNALVTCRSVKAGEILLCEKPTVWMQTPGSEKVAWSCAFCFKELGSCKSQLERFGVDEKIAAKVETHLKKKNVKKKEGDDRRKSKDAAKPPLPCLHCHEVKYTTFNNHLT